MFSQYNQEVSKYTIKDAEFALCFYAYACMVLFLFGRLSRLPNLPIGGIILHIIAISIIIGSFFAIIIKQKQDIASIGIHIKNLRQALILGILFVGFILLQNIDRTCVIKIEVYVRIKYL